MMLSCKAAACATIVGIVSTWLERTMPIGSSVHVQLALLILLAYDFYKLVLSACGYCSCPIDQVYRAMPCKLVSILLFMGNTGPACANCLTVTMLHP